MKWNWQKNDWPEFRYDSSALTALESEFLNSSGVLLGACRHLDEEEFDIPSALLRPRAGWHRSLRGISKP